MTEEVAPNEPALTRSEAVSPPTDEIIISAAAVWNAPLPPPSSLREYNEILPGAADRILQMAEKEQDYSYNLVRTVANSDSRRAYLGLVAGFIISVLGIGGGIYLIATGHDWAGLSLAGINLTGLVGVFVYGAKTRNDDDNAE